MNEDREIMTVQEVADYLKCNRVTVCRALRAKRIPGGFKVGKCWKVVRFQLFKYVGTAVNQKVVTFTHSEPTEKL
jgi:excisionase family DNA binding protein